MLEFFYTIWMGVVNVCAGSSGWLCNSPSFLLWRTGHNMTWLVWYLLLILGVHNTMPYEPSTRLGSPGSIRFSCVVPVKSSYQHLTACLCLRGIEQSTLFYDMPLCMKSELYLEMIRDILYTVTFFRYITFWICSSCVCKLFPPWWRTWLVFSRPDREVRVRAFVEDIVLCSWARHFTLTVSLSTKAYKSVLANLMPCHWLASHPGGSGNISYRFMLQKPC